MKRFLLPLSILIVILACRTGNPDRRLNLYPTATSEATQTPVIVEVTTSPVVVQITTTPIPTDTPRQIKLCVIADEAVYMRPSPSENNYPVTSLTNGVEVTDLGGRDGEWTFVEAGEKRGWVYAKYIKPCE